MQEYSRGAHCFRCCGKYRAYAVTRVCRAQLDLVYDPIFGGYERFKDKEHVRKVRPYGSWLILA